MNIITFVHKLSTGIENLLIAVHTLFQQSKSPVPQNTYTSFCLRKSKHKRSCICDNSVAVTADDAT